MLILGDLEAEHLTETQQRAIVDFVETQGKPVIFLPSRNMLGMDGFQNTELASLLPIDIPRNGCRVEDTEFTLQLTQSGAFHPMLQLHEAQMAVSMLRSENSSAGEGFVATTNTSLSTTDGLRQLIANMPALPRFFSGFRLRGGATTLMDNGKGMPILILQRAGLGKSLLIARGGLLELGF